MNGPIREPTSKHTKTHTHTVKPQLRTLNSAYAHTQTGMHTHTHKHTHAKVRSMAQTRQTVFAGPLWPPPSSAETPSSDFTAVASIGKKLFCRFGEKPFRSSPLVRWMARVGMRRIGLAIFTCNEKDKQDVLGIIADGSWC